jgi:flagellar FliJ protein
MPPPFHLQPLLDLSKLHLDEAARELGQLISGEQEASRRLAILTQYRDEYQAQFRAAAERGLGPAEWANYSNFLARIDDAIVPAAQAVALTQQRTLAGKQNWVGKQGRVRAFDTLADRHRAMIACQENRAEQKITDEHGARSHANKDAQADLLATLMADKTKFGIAL